MTKREGAVAYGRFDGLSKLLPRLAVALGIPLDKIHSSYRNHGHLGGSDIYLGLKTREAEGLIKKGDRMLLSSSAFGFSWGSSLLTKVI